MSFVMRPSFCEAERCASGAAGSGSVADAGSRRLHAMVRLSNTPRCGGFPEQAP